MFIPNDGSRWLAPGEQQEVMSLLLGANLLVCDNGRKLPLKKGGTTDVYINLRNMRNFPLVLRQLAELYSNAIRRLHVDRIVEVPEAVSPLAGVISAMLDTPLITVREVAKAGRVSGGQLIGDVKYGDCVVIVDDVVTDGASKVPALQALKAKGAEIVAIIVLVDRQQGWKKALAAAGYGDVPVWAGMTLHDVRANLIYSGAMQRCDPGIEAKNPLIIALDGLPMWEDALPLVDPLRPTGCIFKANDLLGAGNINDMVRALGVYGRVMVDGKYLDIANTVANYCRRLKETPPWAFTVHASGGSEMMRKAVETFADTATIVLAVTLLTSVRGECETIYRRRPIGQVRKLAELAYNAGVRGFVCSTEEAAMIRRMYSEVTIVVPALRSPDKTVAGDDQKRSGTFVAAYNAGGRANVHLVGGRQFLQNPDPVGEIGRVLREELDIAI